MFVNMLDTESQLICDVCERDMEHGELLINGGIGIFQVDKKLLLDIDKETILDDNMHICSLKCFNALIQHRIEQCYPELTV